MKQGSKKGRKEGRKEERKVGMRGEVTKRMEEGKISVHDEGSKTNEDRAKSRLDDLLDDSMYIRTNKSAVIS